MRFQSNEEGGNCSSLEDSLMLLPPMDHSILGYKSVSLFLGSIAKLGGGEMEETGSREVPLESGAARILFLLPLTLSRTLAVMGWGGWTAKCF